MTNTQEKCDCEEMSCKEGCTRNHTCKKISCEKCDNTQETWREEMDRKWINGELRWNGSVKGEISFERIHKFIQEKLEQAITRTRLEVRKDIQSKTGEIEDALYNYDAYPQSQLQAEEVVSRILALPSLQITDEKK